MEKNYMCISQTKRDMTKMFEDSERELWKPQKVFITQNTRKIVLDRRQLEDDHKLYLIILLSPFERIFRRYEVILF